MVNQLAVDWVAPLSNDTVYVVWALAPPHSSQAHY